MTKIDHYKMPYFRRSETGCGVIAEADSNAGFVGGMDHAATDARRLVKQVVPPTRHVFHEIGICAGPECQRS